MRLLYLCAIFVVLELFRVSYGIPLTSVFRNLNESGKSILESNHVEDYIHEVDKFNNFKESLFVDSNYESMKSMINLLNQVRSKEFKRHVKVFNTLRVDRRNIELKYAKLKEFSKILKNPSGNIVSNEVGGVDGNTLLRWKKWAKSILYSYDEGSLDYELFKMNASLESFAKLGELFDIKRGISCPTENSPHMIMVSSFIDAAVAQLKGLAIEKYARDALGGTLKKRRVGTMEQSFETFQKRMKSLRSILKSSLVTDLPREVRRCDPDHLEFGNHAVVRTFSKFFISTKDFRKEDVSSRKVNQTCLKRGACQDTFLKCQNNVFDCKRDIVALELCPTELSINATRLMMNVTLTNSTVRRFDFVRYTDTQGTVRSYGEKDNCQRDLIKASYEPPFFTKMFSFMPFVHPKYYHECTCSDLPNYNNIFNLNPALSRAFENRVVTGLRLVHEHGLFSLVVQEGMLLPHGQIAESTIRWNEIDYSVGPEILVIGGRGKSAPKSFVVDYNRDRVYLDDIAGPNNTVLTGVRLLKEDSGLELSIRLTPFNFRTGDLRPRASYWVARADKGQLPRREVQLGSEALPRSGARSPVVRTEDDQVRRYVRFQTSSMEQDLGQTTVPYLDTQIIEPRGHLPMSGAGIYYKAGWDSAGFVGLRLLTYDQVGNLEIDEDEIRNSKK